MIEQIRRISGIMFYVMGSVFFLLYFVHRNEFLGQWPRWLMEVFDQSFIFVTLLYAGTSFFLSITDPKKPSKVAIYGVNIPLVCLFLILLLLNYWNALGFGPSVS